MISWFLKVCSFTNSSCTALRLGVAGIVAAAVVLQRRRRRKHARAAELDTAGLASDAEFAPLLTAKKSSATGRGYGAM